MKKLLILSALVLSLVFQFCNSSKKSKSPPTARKITYTSNVQGAVTTYCSPCHIPPKGFKKALDTYDAAKNNIDEMIARIERQPDEKGFMPFKHPKLADSTIAIFVNWKKDGLPEN